MEKHPHVILSTNVLDSIFIKLNGNILKKQKKLIQILLHELRNDLIHHNTKVDLMVLEMRMIVFVLVILLLESTRKKQINPISNRSNITCRYETYISAMLLQCDFNKCMVMLLENLKSFI